MSHSLIKAVDAQGAGNHWEISTTVRRILTGKSIKRTVSNKDDKRYFAKVALLDSESFDLFMRVLQVAVIRAAD